MTASNPQTGAMPAADSQTAGDTAAIRVLASGAVSSVMPELAAGFEHTSGHKLRISYASTNALMGRIKAGESADLVMLLGLGLYELARQGKVAPESCTELATSGIGVAVRPGAPRPDIGSSQAFRCFLLNARSVAYTATGTSGVHFRSVIERLGIAEPVKAKARILPGGLVGEVVARGEAEIGIQMVSEILAVSGVELLGPLPPELQSTTVLSAGVFIGAGQTEAARALLRYISTPASARVLKANGLEPIGTDNR